MKFRITMKDPDALRIALGGAAKKSVGAALGASLDECEEELREFVKRWFKYGEYLTVEIDTDAKTILVVAQQ
jgi:hypothetical protein